MLAGTDSAHLKNPECRRVRAGHDSTWGKTFGCLTDASNRTCAEVHMPGTVQLSQDVRLKMMASVATTSFKAFCFSLSDREGSLTLVNNNGNGKRAHERRTTSGLEPSSRHRSRCPPTGEPVDSTDGASGSFGEEGAPCKRRNKLLHQAVQASESPGCGGRMSRTSFTTLPRGCLKSARLVEPAMCQAESLHHDS